MLSHLITREVTIIRRTIDPDAFDLEATETRTAALAEIQQRSRDEDDGSGELSETKWVGFFAAGTTLDTADAIEDADLGIFELVGDPWPVRNPRTETESHIEATLRKVG